jgi:hypothetical protein
MKKICERCYTNNIPCHLKVSFTTTQRNTMHEIIIKFLCGTTNQYKFRVYVWRCILNINRINNNCYQDPSFAICFICFLFVKKIWKNGKICLTQWCVLPPWPWLVDPWKRWRSIQVLGKAMCNQIKTENEPFSTRGSQLGRKVYETPESDSDSGVNFEDSIVNIKDSGVNFKDSDVYF